MDRRFLQEEGLQVYSGSELLVKGAYEARVALMTGYPGSPVAEFFNTLEATNQLAREKGILLQIANNEALSVARLVGSQMADIRAIACMKSVGMHVAADGLFLGNISKSAGSGGALVIVGDDAWSESTQVPADSRFLSKHLFIPVISPATPQELKDWIKTGLDISARSGLYLTYLVETQQADGGGVVRVYKNHYPEINTNQRTTIDTASIPLKDRISLPPNTGRKEAEFDQKFDALHHAAREFGLDQMLYLPEKGHAPIGFVTSGLSYLYLEHALRELGFSGKFPILKLGLIYPLDPETLLRFSEKVENVIVIEEKRAFIETQVKEILNPAGYHHIYGKQFPEWLKGIPEKAGLNPSILIEALAPLIQLCTHLGNMKMQDEVALAVETQEYDIHLPDRTPTFCPGCPHRDSSSVLLQIKKEFMDPKFMKKEHHAKPVDLVFHGDTGCYSMLLFEPNQDLMHNYAGMGLGGGTGAGIDSFITNKQVVFMGDSTFFHSGLVAISDSLKHGQDITYIILENKTTAMTGHQATPATSEDIMGRPTFIQDIDTTLRGMSHGKMKIVRINPAYRETYRKVLEDTILLDGVKVIIADKECGITYHRRLRRAVKEILQKQKFLKKETKINITPEVCENCLECTKNTGCPGLSIEDTDFGPKIITDLSTCVADTACTKVKACPSFEEVIIKRKQAPHDRLEWIAHSTTMPKPDIKIFDDVWYSYIAGVGGMGAGTVSVVLARAGMLEGYYVTFSDRKGLAIRNGGVFSNVIYSKKSKFISPVIPYGKADLMIGLDLLESVRGLDPDAHLCVGSHNYTHAIVNTARTPTIRTLMGLDSFSTEELESLMKKYTSETGYFGANLSEVAERFLGGKIYVNMILLGIAYQLGELPLGLENIKWAIQISVPKIDIEENLKAFEFGRRIAVNPGRFLKEYREGTLEDVLNDKEDILKRSGLFGGERARDYRKIVEETLHGMEISDSLKRQFALRVYELIQYENLKYARRYARRVRETYDRDHVQFDYKATEAVIKYLFKVMAIKDEIYVSHLLTSEEKRRRDFERYGIHPERGDRLVYHHLTRPEIPVGPWMIRFDITTRDWQLNIMKHLKFLRRLLPKWHAREKSFRAWYEGLVDLFGYESMQEYQTYLECLNCPEEVRGYREIRYPKMEHARLKVTGLLRGSSREPNGLKVAA